VERFGTVEAEDGALAYEFHERLTAMDLSFLAMEDGRAHMHIGSVALFDAEPLTLEGGGIDFDRILSYFESQLHKVPRFRQKIERVPGFGHPVWVDDPSFNLLYHVRHTALPPPGDLRLLKRMAARILSQEFDRGKPLWEYWFVDGVEENRFAVIVKLHHCMADGISGVHMANLLVGPDPDYEPAPGREWLPRPSPSGSQLFMDELRHRMLAPFSLLAGSSTDNAPSKDEGDNKRKRTADHGEEAKPSPSVFDGLRGLVESNMTGTGGVRQTPLNVEIGAYRRFDWARLPFDEVHDIGKPLGAKVNDVVLAVASGALRNFLAQRGVDVDDLDFRALVPVSMRKASEQGSGGNLVSGLIARLPLDEKDPWERLKRVVDMTHELKDSGQSSVASALVQLADLLPTPLLEVLFRQGGRIPVANIVITNVPGPRNPVYLLGARQLECFPVVPLVSNMAIGIALLSYDDGLYWGFNADWDAVPDLHDLAEGIVSGFEELKRAAPRPRASARASAERSA
jgi:diacylglycerol O-acyltransferase